MNNTVQVSDLKQLITRAHDKNCTQRKSMSG